MHFVREQVDALLADPVDGTKRHAEQLRPGRSGSRPRRCRGRLPRRGRSDRRGRASRPVPVRAFVRRWRSRARHAQRALRRSVLADPGREPRQNARLVQVPTMLAAIAPSPTRRLRGRRRSILATVRDLPRMCALARTNVVEYFGDLDRRGLGSPSGAAYAALTWVLSQSASRPQRCWRAGARCAEARRPRVPDGRDRTL